jgi:hypothetical protein
MLQLVSKYRITAILKVETDINTNIATGPIGRSVILMIMYVEVVKREDVYLIMLKLGPYCVTYQNRQNCKNLNILSSYTSIVYYQIIPIENAVILYGKQHVEVFLHGCMAIRHNSERLISETSPPNIVWFDVED